jgi:hypothetical protein
MLDYKIKPYVVRKNKDTVYIIIGITILLIISFFLRTYSDNRRYYDYFRELIILALTVYTVADYLNYRIEVNGDYIAYTNIFRKTINMNFSDLTGYEYKKKYSKRIKDLYSIDLFAGDRRIFRVYSNLNNADLFLNDIRNHNIPEI